MLTVLAIVIVSTLTAVSTFGAGFTNTGGSVYTRVQETRIHTVPAEITWRTGKECVRFRKIDTNILNHIQRAPDV